MEIKSSEAGGVDRKERCETRGMMMKRMAALTCGRLVDSADGPTAGKIEPAARNSSAVVVDQSWHVPRFPAAQSEATACIRGKCEIVLVKIGGSLRKLNAITIIAFDMLDNRCRYLSRSACARHFENYAFSLCMCLHSVYGGGIFCGNTTHIGEAAALSVFTLHMNRAAHCQIHRYNKLACDLLNASTGQCGE